MRGPGFITLALPLLFVSCGGMTSLSPVAPSAALAPAPVSTAPSPSVPPPSAPRPGSQLINGAVGPLPSGTPPCFGDRFHCEVYDFSLLRQGPIEVTLTWEGEPRALLVQLYWAGEGLAHEEVAPRDGPSRISFRRPVMEATNYRLRVVSLEPAMSIPFTLTLTH